jgi:hypothetical protein
MLINFRPWKSACNGAQVNEASCYLIPSGLNLSPPRTAFAGREVLKKSRHRERGFVWRSVNHGDARRLFQAIVFNGLDNCFGNLRGDVVSPARFDVPVDEREDMVNNRFLQLLSLEVTLYDFVYLIDVDG